MAEPLFRSVPCRLAALASPIGLGAEQARFLARTIRRQLQWADPSPRRRLLLITDKPPACDSSTCAEGKNSGLKVQPTIPSPLVFALRQQIAKLGGFSVVQPWLAIADNLDHAQPNKRTRDSYALLGGSILYKPLLRLGNSGNVCTMHRQMYTDAETAPHTRT